MICPKCGSNHIVSNTVTDTIIDSNSKGFGWIKACLGYLIFNIPGLLCGLCGMGKEKRRTTTSTKVIHVCQNCGNRF